MSFHWHESPFDVLTLESSSQLTTNLVPLIAPLCRRDGFSSSLMCFGSYRLLCHAKLDGVLSDDMRSAQSAAGPYANTALLRSSLYR